MIARKLDDQAIEGLATSMRCLSGSKPENAFSATGALMDYLTPNRGITSGSALGTAVLEEIASRLANNSSRSQREALQSVERSRNQASFGSACVLADWGSGGQEPWNRWASGVSDSSFEQLLHRTIFSNDYHSLGIPFSSAGSVNFRELCVGNAHGADLAGLTFYNPQEDTKFVAYPLASESFPNHSILRWFAWQVFLDVAIASVRSHVSRFHDSIDSASDLRHILRSAQDLSSELSEVYDLDLADFFYRREFESLRSITHLDDDFNYLMERFASDQGRASLREQILMNNLILAYTIAGSFAAFAIALGTQQQWSAAGYVTASFAVVGAALGASFGLLEPLRRLLSKAREFRQRN